MQAANNTEIKIKPKLQWVHVPDENYIVYYAPSWFDNPKHSSLKNRLIEISLANGSDEWNIVILGFRLICKGAGGTEEKSVTDVDKIKIYAEAQLKSVAFKLSDIVAKNKI